MEIKSLEISNFRSFSNLKIEPTKINIIVGRNNSGKTSLLEALSLIFNHTYDTRLFFENPGLLINARNSPNQATIKAESKDKLVSITLKRANVEQITLELRNYIIKSLGFLLDSEISKRYFSRRKSQDNLYHGVLNKLNDDGKLDEVVGNFTSTDEFLSLVQNILSMSISMDLGEIHKVIVPDIYKLFDGNAITALVKEIMKSLDMTDKSKVNNIERDLMEIIHLYLSLTRRRMSRGFSQQNKEPSNDIGFFSSKKFKMISHSGLSPLDLRPNIELVETESLKIEEFIKKSNLVSNLQRFSFKSIVFKNDDHTYEIPMELMGDGFVALINLIMNISGGTKGNVVAIEEPERDLHPGYIEEFTGYLVKIAMQSNFQFFITTHSEDFLREIFKLADEEGEVANFISKELSILRMTKIKGNSNCSVRNFSEAKAELGEFELDLRGI